MELRRLKGLKRLKLALAVLIASPLIVSLVIHIHQAVGTGFWVVL